MHGPLMYGCLNNDVSARKAGRGRCPHLRDLSVLGDTGAAIY